MGKFEIPAIPKSTPRAIRFPDVLISKVEEAIQGTDCTFSMFVIAAVENALKDLEQ